MLKNCSMGRRRSRVQHPVQCLPYSLFTIQYLVFIAGSLISQDLLGNISTVGLKSIEIVFNFTAVSILLADYRIY